MELQILNRILFTDLRPEATASWAPDRFSVELAGITAQQIFYPARWEHIFERPLIAAHKYYARIIDSACNTYYNHAASEMQQAGSREEKEYLANSMLRRTLPRLLYDISNALHPGKTTEPETAYNRHAFYEKPDSLYVYGYMKSAAVALYMNIQEQYSEFPADVMLSESELLKLYFNERNNNGSLLRERDKNAQPQLPVNQSIMPKGIDASVNPDVYFLISRLLLKEGIFNTTLERLREYNIIDQNHAFVPDKKNNNARKLAVVCKLLTEQKGLFRNSHPDLQQKVYNQTDKLKLLYQLFKHEKLHDTVKKVTTIMIDETRIQLPWLDQLFPAKNNP